MQRRLDRLDRHLRLRLSSSSNGYQHSRLAVLVVRIRHPPLQPVFPAWLPSVAHSLRSLASDRLLVSFELSHGCEENKCLPLSRLLNQSGEAHALAHICLYGDEGLDAFDLASAIEARDVGCSERGAFVNGYALEPATLGGFWQERYDILGAF